MKEVWKDIPGFEGMYQVSNMGRVKSLERKVRCGNGMGVHIVPERIRKPYTFVHLKSGLSYRYATVCLKKAGAKPVTRQVHRLVAEAFIPNPNGLSDVNHKDEDGLNNKVDNLEWLSHKDNCNYGTRNERCAKSSINHPSISKPILQVSLDGTIIKEFPSVAEAYRQTNVWPTDIRDCANHGRHKTAGGFRWEWANRATH